MTTWVVSTHAATNANPRNKQFKLVQLPQGVRFYFFCREGTPLAVSLGWDAYNLCMKSRPTPQDYMALAKLPGYEMFNKPALPDYDITGDDSWIDANGRSASGIFMFGDNHHASPNTTYLRSGEWTKLSTFIAGRQWKPGDQVYWLACRSWN